MKLHTESKSQTKVILELAIETIVNGFVKITVSPLQKIFGLTSRDMGFVASSYDITSIIAVIPLTYFCGMGHKPLVIGLSLVLFGRHILGRNLLVI